MHRIHVVIPLEPFGKEAPRARVFHPRPNTSVSRIYKSSRTASYMTAAGAYMLKARNEAGVYAPLDGPLRVQMFAFHGEVPLRLLREHSTGVLIRKDTRPDTDNIQKIIGDAGNKILWADDAQIVEWTASKWYAQLDTAPRVEVVVEGVDRLVR